MPKDEIDEEQLALAEQMIQEAQERANEETKMAARHQYRELKREEVGS